MKFNPYSYQQVKSCLKELSDRPFQERVWVKGDGPEKSSYVEVVCQLFDDTGLGEELEKEDQPVFSPKADETLRDLSGLINKIDYKLGSEKIINLPVWPRVMELSHRALKILERQE